MTGFDKARCLVDQRPAAGNGIADFQIERVGVFAAPAVANRVL